VGEKKRTKVSEDKRESLNAGAPPVADEAKAENQ
jgi:hypothetical protein